LKDLSAEFKRHDTRSEGVLDREEFTDCLVRFGFKLRKELQRDLSDSLSQADQEKGSRSRRAVDYGDFVAAVKAEHEAEGAAVGSLDRVKEGMRRELKRGTGMQEVSLLPQLC
jgi:Ca2+-binding EF-hand superfamily protein